ncbi:MAG TPA: hypothetical protein DEQ02_00245 [Ruminococcaceae bacterium]|nr:hypothetical protein [Oscillospiraceae bacterium]
MKFTKECPKCHSNDIIRIPGETQSGGMGNNIRAGVTVFSAVMVTKYLCCNCGFIEEWVDSPQDMAKAKKYYAR